MSEAMAREVFPSECPPDSSAAAFRSGKDLAQKPALAVAALDWLGLHGYAVLGKELWLLQGNGIPSLPIGLDGMRGVCGNTVNRKYGDGWISFVTGASAETLSYLREFKTSDIAEGGKLYFNFVWVSEEGFENLLNARR
jgi:hypothetical protein